MGTGEPPVVCAVCRRPLDMVELSGKVVWQHTLMDVEAGVDHDPVPSRVPGFADVVSRCDFCGYPGTVVVFDCQDFRLDADGYASAGGWGACASCVLAVRERDREALVERALERHIGLDKRMRRMLADQIGRIHDAFFAHQTGTWSEVL